uniref:Double strand RNA binding domain from DEAD END PROTEIN 1 n=1 Tax=Myoviridae sp. ct1Js5 TaxID=2826601 RepID=A0A8S5M917_9CAUD|nr:MAG TPA: double strand RNA binding domain from DEAD END PROTEIN 1 [Myoviridae sp. ct1Js5]
MQKLQDWCKQHHWQPPAFRYEPNSLELLWQDSTAQWLPLAVHPLYQAEVNGK